MKPKKKIAIIGAGPGGLTAGMLLAHKGFEVTIFEKQPTVGGRNAKISLEGGFSFDLGPTFLMMKYVLDEMFARVGRRSEDLLSFTQLDPLYHLSFAYKSLDMSSDAERMKQEWQRVFPEEVAGLEKLEKREGERLKKLLPVLMKDYGSFVRIFEKDFLAALPHFALGKSLFDVLGDYFTSSDARICFTFQSKYLGMSPWECPGAFGIIPFIEHHFGIYHVEGGLGSISKAMERVVIEEGGVIRCNAAVEEVLFDGKRAVGLRLASGEEEFFDSIVVNADFGKALTALFPDGSVPAYTHHKVTAHDFSCSTMMLYLGLSRKYNLRHHTIIFADDYKTNVENIFSGKPSFPDFSLYVCNPSAIDATLAPEGKSALYVLVPVPNRKLGNAIDWAVEAPLMRARIFEILNKRLGLDDIEAHIEAEKIITPLDWEQSRDVLFGATFNLSHSLNQMLWFRPHNKLQSVENVYLVGGGTHPGSGLPTIYESARITTDLLCQQFSAY